MSSIKKSLYSKILSNISQVLEIPEGYNLSEVKENVQNDNEVFIFRYVKDTNNPQLMGEHFSFTVDTKSNKILGFTWMDKRFKKGQLLPSKSETEEIAKQFISKIQPDLINDLEHKWTDEHDETIILDEEIVTITGMKYKCYVPNKKNYAWVVIGHDGKVITFEQDIIWKDGRISEKWLHDSWILDNL